jgi:hypothetical protein
MHARSLVLGLWPAACILVVPSSAQEPPSWQQYVRAPDSVIVRPATILSSYTQGNIENADGLVTGAAATVLTKTSDSDETPTLVVDFGQNVVGQLLLEFAEWVIAGLSRYSIGVFGGPRVSDRSQ